RAAGGTRAGKGRWGRGSQKVRSLGPPAVDAVLTEEVGDLVGQDDEDGADDTLGETCRGTDRPVATDDAGVVRVGVQHFGGVRADGVALEDELLEADGE